MNKLMVEDPEIYKAIELELERQNNKIEMIASENFVSELVMEAQGSILTNKYAEGYPGNRYHSGCECVDIVESIAIDRAKKLFNAEYANVQPHSGVNANLAVYVAMLKPGDTILGMKLDHGGHLSHGSKVNISGKFFNCIGYGVRKDTETIDFDEVRDLALKYKPKIIVAGTSSYSRIIDYKIFREIADEIGAYLMVDMSHISGLVAAGYHPNPVEYADFVTSTTTKTIRGARGGIILCKKEYGPKIDKTVFPGIQGGPQMNTIAGKAVCFREAMKDEFKVYIKQVLDNSKLMAEMLKDKGYRIVTGGTDTHLFLVDLRNKGLTGKVAEEALNEVGITVNKNMIPFDPETPVITSGIRIGTSAITTRGMKEEEVKEISELIDISLNNIGDEKVKEDITDRIKQLCRRFPIYGYQFNKEEYYAG